MWVALRCWGSERARSRPGRRTRSRALSRRLPGAGRWGSRARLIPRQGAGQWCQRPWCCRGFCYTTGYFEIFWLGKHKLKHTIFTTQQIRFNKRKFLLNINITHYGIITFVLLKSDGKSNTQTGGYIEKVVSTLTRPGRQGIESGTYLLIK